MVPNLDFSERIFISLILDMNIVQASFLEVRICLFTVIFYAKAGKRQGQ